MLIFTTVTVLYSLCETLPAAYNLLLIEVHMHIFEFLLLFFTKQYNAERLQTSDITLPKKKVSISPFFLDSHSTQQLNGCLTLSACSNPYSSTIPLRASCSKPHRGTHTATTNMKNRVFLCTDTNSLHSEFLVILQVRITSGSGNNTVQHHFLFIQQQLERLPCSFVKDFWTEVCERLHVYECLINP